MLQNFQGVYDHGQCSGVFTANFDHNSHLFLVLLLILIMYLFASSPVFSENGIIPESPRRLVNL